MSDDLRSILFEELKKLAPEADYDELEDDDSLREELDIDSMDFLKLMQALHARTGVDVPEIEYPKLDSVEGAIEYISARR